MKGSESNILREARVAHLTSVHSPHDNRIFESECRTLATAGFEVVLVAPADGNTIEDGVQICAVPKRNGRAARVMRTVWDVYRKARKARALVYHVHDPELLPVAFLLKMGGSRVIYDVHEDVYADVLNKDWIPIQIRKTVAKILRKMNSVAGQRLSAIVAATESISKTFPAAKTVVVHNYPDFDPKENADEVPPSAANYVVYVGSISRIRGIEEMIRAVDFDGIPADVRLLLAGEFEDDVLRTKIQGLKGWRRVQFFGWLPRLEIKRILNRAKIGLVLFHSGPNHDESLPAKLFEYMAAGIPVIVSDFPLWRRIIETERCGLVVDPMNCEEVSKAIAHLLSHPDEAKAMGIRGREAVIREYNWQHEGEKLVSLYRKLV